MTPDDNFANNADIRAPHCEVEKFVAVVGDSVVHHVLGTGTAKHTALELAYSRLLRLFRRHSHQTLPHHYNTPVSWAKYTPNPPLPSCRRRTRTEWAAMVERMVVVVAIVFGLVSVGCLG